MPQYRNEYNPIAHYDETAEEIYHQMDGKLTCLFTYLSYILILVDFITLNLPLL